MLARPIFEYYRFRAQPRELLDNAADVGQRFDQRAEQHGGKLFACWQSLVGLGLARDEGIALTTWPNDTQARAATPVDGLADSQRTVLRATVRPTHDYPPDDPSAPDPKSPLRAGFPGGVYVFRWFSLAAQDWESFRDLSDLAWPNMESVFDVNIIGFWRSLDIAEPNAQVLLLTRYADLSVWEASRWWSKPVADAAPSMEKFKQRNNVIEHTVAYPARLINCD